MAEHTLLGPVDSKNQLPSLNESPSPAYQIDREDAFLIFTAFCGDIQKTSNALNIPPAYVAAIATKEQWHEKLGSILELYKGKKPGDVERAINRAVSFVQAHRLKTFLNRILNHLIKKGEIDLDDVCSMPALDKNGLVTGDSKLVTRPLADLAAALEKAHAMAYIALNDTAPERIKRASLNPAEDDSLLDLHAKLTAAMKEVSDSKTPAARIFDAQLVACEGLTPSLPVPEIPKLKR